MRPIPTELLLYCFGVGALYLFFIHWALSALERYLSKMGLWGDFPESLLRPQGKFISFGDLTVQIALFVALPVGFYSWMYMLLPLEGMRAGVGIALWTAMVGALPLTVTLNLRTHLPGSALAFYLMSYIIKLAGTLAIIGYLFSL